MNKGLTILGVALLAAIAFFLGILLNTLVGIFVGWVVGLFFSETILSIFAMLGIKGVAMWQVGAFLGFVGGFFRTTVTNKKE